MTYFFPPSLVKVILQFRLNMQITFYQVIFQLQYFLMQHLNKKMIIIEIYGSANSANLASRNTLKRFKVASHFFLRLQWK